MALTIVRTATSSQINSLLTQAAASATYLTQASASATYLTKASASTTYATKASPTLTGTIALPDSGITDLGTTIGNLNSGVSGLYSANFLTQYSASSTYLTQSSASTTYAIKSSPIFTGTVTMPSQPAFRYHGFTINGNGMQGGSAPLNVGSNLVVYPVGNANYSRFTAPVSGRYVFGISALVDQSGSRVEMVLRKNGSTSIDGYAYYAANDFGGGTSQYVTALNSFVVNLSQNDYVDFYLAVAGTIYSDLTRGDRQFWGYLLG